MLYTKKFRNGFNSASGNNHKDPGNLDTKGPRDFIFEKRNKNVASFWKNSFLCGFADAARIAKSFLQYFYNTLQATSIL